MTQQTPNFSGLAISADQLKAFQAKIEEQDAERGTGFAPIPDAEYPVVIKSCKNNVTRSGGAQLRIVFMVLNGPYKGSLFGGNLNYKCENPVAVGIAMEQIARIALYGGLPSLQNPEKQFPGIVLRVKTKTDRGTATGENGEEVETVRTEMHYMNAPRPGDKELAPKRAGAATAPAGNPFAQKPTEEPPPHVASPAPAASEASGMPW